MNLDEAVIDYDKISNLVGSMSILEKAENGTLKIRFFNATLYAHIEIRVTKSDGVVVDALELLRTETGPSSIRMELLHGDNHEFFGYRISDSYVMSDLILCIAVLELVCRKIYMMYQNTPFVPCMPSLELLNKAGDGLAIYHPTRRNSRHTNDYHEKEGFRTIINYQPKESHRTTITSKVIRGDMGQFDVMLNECELMVSTSSHVNIDLIEYRSVVNDIMQKMDRLRGMLSQSA